MAKNQQRGIHEGCRKTNREAYFRVDRKTNRQAHMRVDRETKRQAYLRVVRETNIIQYT